MVCVADLWWSCIVIYPAECNLFGRQMVLLVPEEWETDVLTAAVSVLVICLHLLAWHLTDLRPGLWLQVCANVCVQLDPISILPKRHRLPRNIKRAANITSIILCQRKEWSQAQIDASISGLTRASSHLVQSAVCPWGRKFLHPILVHAETLEDN